MKREKVESDEVRTEYELSGGVKKHYADRFARGTNLVMIEPDLFIAFPSADEVNNALRALSKAGAQAVKSKPQRQAKAS